MSNERVTTLTDDSLEQEWIDIEARFNALAQERDRRRREAKARKAADIAASGLADAVDAALAVAIPRAPIDWRGWPGTQHISQCVASILYDRGYRKV